LPGPGAAARGEELAAAAGVAAGIGPGAPAGLALAERAGDAVVAAAKASSVSTAGAEDEAWERVRVSMTDAERERIERAMALAGRVLGARSPRWQRLEAICQEYLGDHATDADADDLAAVEHSAVADWLEGAKAALEEELDRWGFLEPVEAVPAPLWPGPGGGDAGDDRPDGDPHATDPLLLDARLRELAAMRARWDVLLGHLAMLLKTLGLWRDAGFASLGHYAEERLGLSARALEQRAALAKRSYELPGLREAMADGRLPYEKARLVARAADEDTVGTWIARAQRTTALDLRRELEAAEERQMCARGDLEVVVPRRVRVLVDALVRAARQAEKRWMKSGECLAVAADHFVATWEPLVPRRRTRSQKVLDRDGGRCQVPGCSRAAAHAHHVRFRSAGGGDEDGNLVSLCPAHHLHGVHTGWIEVRGEAPGRLVWRMAAPPIETESVEAWSPGRETALAAA
ncbi:MAG TPA: HNH endonuclease signature motif containing protein, partial [Anaeromyxobacter sp.]